MPKVLSASNEDTITLSARSEGATPEALPYVCLRYMYHIRHHAHVSGTIPGTMLYLPVIKVPPPGTES